MATFCKTDGQSNATTKAVKENVQLQQPKKSQSRKPLQCITNGNGNQPANIAQERNCATASAQTLNNIEFECLQLVGNENFPVEFYAGCNDLKTNEDINVLVNYGRDLWKHLYKQEGELPWPNPNYMLKQTQLSFDMRSVLIDWLVSVAHEYKMQEQTIYLAVNYIDRFLSIMSVVRDKFQLLGAAAMMLAVKFEEVVILNAKEWALLTGDGFTSRQIIRMEQLLLNVLNFDVNPPTVINFLQQTCVTFNLDRKTLYLAMFVMELTLLEGSYYLKHLPSKLAVSSIVLARYVLHKSMPYFTQLQLSSGYDFSQIKPLILKQHSIFQDSPTKRLQAIQNKYKTERYLCVASLAPTSLQFEDEQ